MKKIYSIGLILGLCLALFLAGCSAPTEVKSARAEKLSTPSVCDCTNAVEQATDSQISLDEVNGVRTGKTETWEDMYNFCVRASESNEASCQVMKEALINNTKICEVNMKFCASEMKDWQHRYETCTKQ